MISDGRNPAGMSEAGVIEWIRGASPLLDGPMATITLLATHAALWFILAFVMTCSKNWRSTGIAVIVAIAMAYIVTDLLLKPLVDRPRPFEVLDLTLIVDPPTTASFPSGHTASSFAAAACILLKDRRAGIAAVAFACLVGLSRIYLGVHWPTDVIAGAIVGILCAFAATYLVGLLYHPIIEDRRAG